MPSSHRPLDTGLRRNDWSGELGNGCLYSLRRGPSLRTNGGGKREEGVSGGGGALLTRAEEGASVDTGLICAMVWAVGSRLRGNDERRAGSARERRGAGAGVGKLG